MAGQTPTTFDGLLKDVYRDILAGQIDSSVELRKYFENRGNKDTVDGRKAVFPVIVQRSWSAGSPGNSTLPSTVNYVESDQFEITYKRLYGRIRLDRMVIEQSRSDAGAFAKAMKVETTNMLDTLRVIHNRQLHFDGTGKLAEVASLSGQNITMNATYGHGGGLASITGAGARYIREGMTLAVMQGTGTTLRQGDLVVTAVNYTTHVVTVTGTTTGIADGDSVYMQIATSVYAQNNEWMGLGGMIDDGTILGEFQALSRTTYPLLKSPVLGNSGTERPFSGSLCQDALDLSHKSDGSSDIRIWWTCHEVRNTAANTLVANKRYTSSKDMGVGFRESNERFDSDVTFGMTRAGKPIPMFADREALYHYIYGIDPSTLRLFELQKLEWAEIQGKMWHAVDGYDDMQAWCLMFGNAGCTHPKKNVLITDIQMTPQTGFTPS